MRAVLGLAGWAYPEWVGPFYPRGTSPSGFLEAYSRAFPFVEVDSTYYEAPAADRVSRWARITPPGFTFSPKLPRTIVADRKLVDADEAVAEFLRRLSPLREAGKLGPVLASMPPSFRRETHGRALSGFLEGWPRNVRLAVELRHASWWTPSTFELLRAHQAIHVWSVTEHGRTPPEVTTGDVYLRLIGDRALDRVTTRWDKIRRDQTAELAYWRETLARLHDELDAAWIIANNHFMGYAPETARRIAEILGMVQPDLAAAMRDARQRRLGDDPAG